MHGPDRRNVKSEVRERERRAVVRDVKHKAKRLGSGCGERRLESKHRACMRERANMAQAKLDRRSVDVAWKAWLGRAEECTFQR